MPHDRRRSLLAWLAVILAGMSFVYWATRPVPHDECVVAYSVFGKPTGRELDEYAQQAYEEAVADGRCEPPWPRWRGWVG
ncbi:hypothetical protein ACIBAG_07875 [Streptomyces sp. NPDC051243]|uniref:hypothetical protein n=1 Tax=Streptomyces sp. NPDC051243 TaxID=3365646 RepID=UPI0037A70AB9